MEIKIKIEDLDKLIKEIKKLNDTINSLVSIRIDEDPALRIRQE